MLHNNCRQISQEEEEELQRWVTEVSTDLCYRGSSHVAQQLSSEGELSQISQEELQQWATEVSTDMCYWGKDLGCLLEVVTYSDAEKSSGTNFPFFEAAVQLKLFS